MIMAPNQMLVWVLGGGVLSQPGIVVWGVMERWSFIWQAWLWPLRRQSSPRRIFGFPSDPVWCMLKATAIIGSGCGNGRRVAVSGCVRKGTAGVGHQ